MPETNKTSADYTSKTKRVQNEQVVYSNDGEHQKWFWPKIGSSF